MLRLFVFLVALLLIFALLVGADRLRRVLYLLLGIMVVYAVLKTAGVIDAIAPDRIGVF